MSFFQEIEVEDDLEETMIDDSDKDADAEEEIQVKKDKDMKLKSDKMAQVKHEDSKERIIDEEKEKRTVFVGNLNRRHKLMGVLRISQSAREFRQLSWLVRLTGN